MSKAALRIVKAGLATMLQGRPYRGLRHTGMPLAGAADPLSLAAANFLVGNEAECVAIETAFAPVEFEAIGDAAVGIAGAGAADVSINGRKAPAHETLFLKKGDLMRIGAPRTGCRSYIALAGGGFSCPEIMDAQSTYPPGGFGGLGLLSDGQVLEGEGGAILDHAITLPEALREADFDGGVIRIVAGPESDSRAIAALTRREGWQIGQRADRAGIELEGKPIRSERPDARMLSSPTFPGIIQCPPRGLPYILGVDAATMGGYPRIALVIRADRHRLGQLRPGGRLRLLPVKPERARTLYAARIGPLREWLPDLLLD